MPWARWQEEQAAGPWALPAPSRRDQPAESWWVGAGPVPPKPATAPDPISGKCQSQ